MEARVEIAPVAAGIGLLNWSSEDEQLLQEICSLAQERGVLETSAVGATELRPEHRLIEDVQLDSIARLSLAVEIENAFRVAFSEQDDADMSTVGDLVRTVKRLRDAGPEVSQHSAGSVARDE